MHNGASLGGCTKTANPDANSSRPPGWGVLPVKAQVRAGEAGFQQLSGKRQASL